MLSLELLKLTDPIGIDSIICAQGCDNYTWLHYANRPKYLSSATLKEFETRLPSFIRIHKSSLINPAHAVRMKSDHYRHLVIYMSNGMVIPVARRRAELVRQLLDRLI